MAGRRVLITGIAGELPGLLAGALEQRDDIEEIVGVDVREPRHDLRRTEFVRADIRNPLVARIITGAGIDTVAHLSVMPAPGGVGSRSRMKEQNVIGTMQLMAACQKAETLERVVLKSSTAVYGSDHTDPALLAEDATPRVAPSHGFGKDMTEVEGYVRSLGRRRKDVSVTLLRFANFLGGGLDSLFANYFAMPVVPSVLGYDPRLQFCHPDDAVEVLVRSITEDHPGIFNVSGPGILYLSQSIRLARRAPLPVPLPFVSLAGDLVRRTGRVDYSPEQLRFLQFGRVGDITRLREVFGYEPRYTTREALLDHLEQRDLGRPPPRPDDEDGGRELIDFMAHKGRERFAAARRGADLDGEGGS